MPATAQSRGIPGWSLLEGLVGRWDLDGGMGTLPLFTTYRREASGGWRIRLESARVDGSRVAFATKVLTPAAACARGAPIP